MDVRVRASNVEINSRSRRTLRHKDWYSGTASIMKEEKRVSVRFYYFFLIFSMEMKTECVNNKRPLNYLHET